MRGRDQARESSRGTLGAQVYRGYLTSGKVGSLYLDGYTFFKTSRTEGCCDMNLAER